MNLNICNNCGGDYTYKHGRWVCRSCGSYKPEELSNEETTLLYTAYQKLRLAEFDEAEQAFDDILEKYSKNPSAYWGRLMARYGIKYEEDFDGRMIPTCYATSIQSVTGDGDYRKACEYADAENRAYYEKQAEYMERVRREWVEKAKKEKPYDIFISYKESDLANGIDRTQDSITAQEIYLHLLEQGYRVFYSRESLREKTGEKYEPYIFSALSTAKVMLVYGTKPEYVRSTWVKNEWHRFAKRIAEGEKHPESLLVACEGFSPGELPHGLASRQCFDAARKTFFGDLDRCIERIVRESGKSAPPPKKTETSLSALHEHSYKKTVVKPTCVAMGYTLHRCACGEEYRDSYTPLADHSFKVTKRTEPTCTKEGREEKTCEVCGEKQSAVIPAQGHQFSKWTETKRPTCTENGEEQRKCVRCGGIEKNVLPKTGHSFGNWVKNADGTSTGYCKNCGVKKTKTDKPERSAQEIRRDKKENWIIFAVCFALLVAAAIGIVWYIRASAEFQFAKLPDGTYEITKVNYVSSDGRLEIPSTYKGVPVTVIGDGFVGMQSSLVTSLVIPDSVTAIGKEAFRDCERLTSIEIPDSVTVIGEYAFYNCKNLTDVIIPDSVTTIEKSAFFLCESLENLIIGDGVTTIGNNAFAYAGPGFLTSVVIPEGVTVIGDWAFEGCNALASVVIPKSVTKIGYEAFIPCNNLKYIYFTGSESDWKEIVDSTGTPIVDSAFFPFPSEAEVIFDFSGSN